MASRDRKGAGDVCHSLAVAARQTATFFNPRDAVKPIVADINSISPVRCPCGFARRAFADVPGAPASVHRVEIQVDARTHYHKVQTETYYVLECEANAAIELNGELVPVAVGTAIMIPPGVRHRAVGRMTILNVVVPPFDEADEWFD